MTIRYILGRSGTGKTSRCLDEIRASLKDNPQGPPLIWLVPEQATFQAEQAIVSTPGLSGTIRAQALSFRRLAYRIMQETGGTALVPIDEAGKTMLLYSLLQTFGPELRQFGASASQMGFASKLSRLFGELRQFAVSPERLEPFVAMAEQRNDPAGPDLLPTDKLHDLLFLYKQFEQRLSGKYVYSEHLLSTLVEGLAESAFVRGARIWVDGFNRFTPQELLVLGELMRHCEVTVCLCVGRDYDAADEPDELDLFHPPARALVRLKRLAEAVGTKHEETVFLGGPAHRYRGRPLLHHLEATMEQRVPRPYRGPTGSGREIAIAAAANRRAEAEGTAREMLRLVREEGWRWRDMAVLVRQLDSYADVVATAFSDYGIPFFLDRRRTVLHHPVVELVRSSLEAIAGKWTNDAVFRAVKTGLLVAAEQDAPDSARKLRDEMCRLENYVLAAGIRGSRWTEQRAWSYRVGSSLDEGQEETESNPNEAFYTEMDRLRRQVARPLTALESHLRQASNVRGQAEALFSFLEHVGVAEQLERWSREALEAGRPEQAREHAQIWDSLIDLLDQIVEMMGEEKLPLDRFAGIVDAGLETIRLGLVPPSLDQVLVGSMDRTRAGHVRHCFILGANDGVIPARPEEDGIFSDPERERLLQAGLELAETGRRQLLDESFLLYNALTAPSESLWVSYPLADEEGRGLLPSELIRRLRFAFPGIAERRLLLDASADSAEAERDAGEYAALPGQAISHLAVQLRSWMHGTAIAPAWWEVYNWFCARPEWREQLRRTLWSLFYTNEEKPLSATISRELYGDTLRASVSRMERFVSCPFSQFVSHGLRLSERAVYRLDAPDIGQLFHAALGKLAIELQAEGSDWGALTAEQCRERAARIVDELTPRLQGEILLSSRRYGYIARKLKQIVSRAAIVLGSHARSGQFVPVGLELGFGPDQPLPPLRFTLDNGCAMEIVGRIDRVDKAEGGRGVLLRVIDYKSSETVLHMADVYYGMSLQMLTYLDVVITHAEQWLGTAASPAGVLYFHVHNPMLLRKNSLTAEEAEEALLKRFKMKGLVLADAETAQLMDSSLRERSGHSQLIPVAMKADGSFYKASSVVPEQQWERLRGFVRQTIQQIGASITDGNVAIRPARMGMKLACTYCTYKPVCQFEPLLEGNDYNRLRRIDKEQVWQAIEQIAREET